MDSCYPYTMVLCLLCRCELYISVVVTVRMAEKAQRDLIHYCRYRGILKRGVYNGD